MRYINGIAILDHHQRFPDPLRSYPDRPVAIGTELTAELMLKAYQCGIFPWSVHPVTWWSPDPRAIFELDGIYVSRRLARTIRRQKFQVVCDSAFEQVVCECAQPRKGHQETWLSPEFMTEYQRLFEAGFAHSVECWNDGQLVGGVLGVAIGGFFAGDTMFHRQPDASKVALYFLIQLLKQQGYLLFDIQVLTDHTLSLGAVEIPRSEYLQRLKQALAVKPGKFSFS